MTKNKNRSINVDYYDNLLKNITKNNKYELDGDKDFKYPKVRFCVTNIETYQSDTREFDIVEFNQTPQEIEKRLKIWFANLKI